MHPLYDAPEHLEFNMKDGVLRYVQSEGSAAAQEVVANTMSPETHLRVSTIDSHILRVKMHWTAQEEVIALVVKALDETREKVRESCSYFEVAGWDFHVSVGHVSRCQA